MTVAGIWKADPDSVFFRPFQIVTRRELAGALVRLRQSLPDPPPSPELPATPRFTDVPAEDPDREVIETMIAWGKFGEQEDSFDPSGKVSWADLNRWLVAMGWPGFSTLVGKTAENKLTRAECVEYLGRVWTRR